MATGKVLLGKKLDKIIDTRVLEMYRAGLLDESLMGLIKRIPMRERTKDMSTVGGVGKIRKWKGEVEYDSFAKYEFQLEAEKYVQALSFGLDDVEDGYIEMSVINDRIMEGMGDWQRFILQKVNEIRVNGESLTCFDGTPFFGTAHPNEDGTTSSNLITGAGTTLSNFESDLDKVVQAFLGLKSRSGHHLYHSNNLKLHIAHSPAHWNTWRQIFNKVTKSGGSGEGNEWYQYAKHTATGELSGGTWYAEVLSDNTTEPYLLGERKLPKGEWNKDDSVRIEREEMLYVVKARFATGPGNWRRVQKVTN